MKKILALLLFTILVSFGCSDGSSSSGSPEIIYEKEIKFFADAYNPIFASIYTNADTIDAHSTTFSYGIENKTNKEYHDVTFSIVNPNPSKYTISTSPLFPGSLSYGSHYQPVISINVHSQTIETIGIDIKMSSSNQSDVTWRVSMPSAHVLQPFTTSVSNYVTELDFGVVEPGTQASKDFLIFNTRSGLSLRIDNLAFAAGGIFSFDTDIANKTFNNVSYGNCYAGGAWASLNASSGCYVTVNFRQAASGKYTDNVTVKYHMAAGATPYFEYATVNLLANNSSTASAKTTTFMMYLIGSNLESDYGLANLNIEHMLQADNPAPRKVNVVLQTGGADITYHAADQKPVSDWKTVRRHIVTPGAITELSNLGVSCNSRAGITSSCVEMGSPDTLSDFVKYGVANYPADRYVLVLWNHGGGPIDGYGGPPAAKMTLPGIKRALDESIGPLQLNVNLDILGFDACLMGTLETADTLRDHTRFMVASEEVEPGPGWDYKAIISALGSAPETRSQDIGKIIVDSFIDQNDENDDLTLSVIDISKIDAVTSALNNFATDALVKFKAEKQNQWLTFYKARRSVEEFGAFYGYRDFVNTMDLKDYMDALNYFDPASYSSYAASVGNAVTNAVYYNRNMNGPDYAYGMGIWMPYHGFNPDDFTMLRNYNLLYGGGTGFAQFSKPYRDLITTLFEYAVATPTEFSIGSPSVSGGKLKLDVHSNFGIDATILLYNNDSTGKTLKPYVSGVADSRSDGSEHVVEVDFDHKILSLNNFPAYMLLSGRMLGRGMQGFGFSVPLYYKENSSVLDTDAKLVTLDITYNFTDGTYDVSSTLTPADSSGRDEILLETGNILIIPEITVDAAGDVHANMGANKFMVTVDANGNSDIVVNRVSVTGDPLYAFYLINLKDDVAMTPYFDNHTNNMATLLSQRQSSGMQNIANALNHFTWK